MALKIKVTGTVQGVGFRPFVYGIATQLRLRGFVRNSGGAVEISVAGASGSIAEFLQRLRVEAPPLAVIDNIDVQPENELDTEFAEFLILHSRNAETGFQTVPPDTATCELCMADVRDSNGRRYQYPFTNCTACGPRFTIIQELPYDRRATTMAEFKMCPHCRDEFEDPTDRRFHAQPNACWECGPRIWFTTGGAGAEIAPSGQNAAEQLLALDRAADLIARGGILAMKGLGGFHLVCDATNPEAVSLLRTRKKRNEKPFAVMFINIPHVRSYADLDDDAEQLLKGPRRPIVLLPSKENLPSEIAPGISFVGVMLPYTPLHHLLMKRCDKPLVMTSGNFSDEPICMENAEALERLSAIADAFLLHNRRIETRFDDSVVKHDRGCNILIRRSRGYAPQPVSLPGTIDGCVLAVGAELKNTFCLAKDKHAFLSQHIGDLDDVSAYEFFQNTLEKFGHLFDLEATVIAHDLHPDYMSTRIASEIAKRKSIPSYGVQHHHAHIVGCMADNGITERVIGVALDGTGYGDDGTIWGGEFLIADYVGYERFAKFAPVKMPGAEAAVRQPARMLASYEKGHPFIRERLQRLFNQKEASAVRSQLEHDLNCCWTSSCGRLFDAVSALLGICPKPSFEGQAAMMLECVAQKGARTQFEYKAEAEGLVDGYAIIGLLADLLQRGTDEADVAFAFHEILASEISRICLAAAMRERIQTVCLSGGCFQNSLLLSLTMEKLKAVGLNVVIPNRIPPNDGGISLGQSLVAAAAAGKWSTI